MADDHHGTARTDRRATAARVGSSAGRGTARRREARSVLVRSPRLARSAGDNAETNAGCHRDQRRECRTPALRFVSSTSGAGPEPSRARIPRVVRTAMTSPSAPPRPARAEALDEELTNEAPAARSDADADRDLSCASGGTREQQVRDVRARDQQDDRHHPHQQQQGLRVLHLSDPAEPRLAARSSARSAALSADSRAQALSGSSQNGRNTASTSARACSRSVRGAAVRRWPVRSSRRGRQGFPGSPRRGPTSAV